MNYDTPTDTGPPSYSLIPANETLNVSHSEPPIAGTPLAQPMPHLCPHQEGTALQATTTDNHSTLIADTGCTHHFGHTKSNNIQDSTPTMTPISVRLPNGTHFDSTHIGRLNTLNVHERLPATATEIHQFPHIDNDLLSIGQLCDAGCMATFTKHHCSIDHNGHTLLTGSRNHTTNQLWHIDNQPQHAPTPATNAASAHTKERILYAHAIFFSPVPATMLKALQHKYIHGIPGLSLHHFKANQPHTIATAKGHLDQERQNKHSTKTEQIGRAHV